MNWLNHQKDRGRLPAATRHNREGAHTPHRTPGCEDRDNSARPQVRASRFRPGISLPSAHRTAPPRQGDTAPLDRDADASSVERMASLSHTIAQLNGGRRYSEKRLTFRAGAPLPPRPLPRVLLFPLATLRNAVRRLWRSCRPTSSPSDSGCSRQRLAVRPDRTTGARDAGGRG